MPVLREDQEKRTGRRGRRWWWLLVVPPLLVLLLLLVLLVRPVALNVGDQWVVAESRWSTPPVSVPEGFGAPAPVPGPASVEISPLGVWQTARRMRIYWLRVGPWFTYVYWFRGRKVR